MYLLMKNFLRRPIAIMSALLITGLVLGLISLRAQSAERNRQAIGKQEFIVKRGELESTVILSGTVKATRAFPIFSTGKGQILDLLVSEGSLVGVGQPLFRVSSDSAAQQSLLERESRLEEARIEMEAARTAAIRQSEVETLLDGSVVLAMQKEAKRTAAAYASAKKELQALRSSLGLAAQSNQRNSDSALQPLIITVRSPVAGLVSFISKGIGDPVFPVQYGENIEGLEVMNIVQGQEMIVRTRVMETDFPNLKTGMRAKVTLDAFRSTPYQAILTRIGRQASVDKKSGMTFFEADFTVENSDGNVQSQMNARVDVTIERKDSALYLPVSAVAVSGHKAWLQTTPNFGPLKYKAVQIGVRSSENVEIISSDVNEGDVYYAIDFARFSPDAFDTEGAENALPSKAGEK